MHEQLYEIKEKENLRKKDAFLKNDKLLSFHELDSWRGKGIYFYSSSVLEIRDLEGDWPCE